MTLWKDERRIRPCRDQSQISARFVGNRTVEPCTRRRGRLIDRDSLWLQYSVDLCRISKKSFTVSHSQSTCPIASLLPGVILRSESKTQFALTR
jgi:hypothetical protein